MKRLGLHIGWDQPRNPHNGGGAGSTPGTPNARSLTPAQLGTSGDDYWGYGQIGGTEGAELSRDNKYCVVSGPSVSTTAGDDYGGAVAVLYNDGSAWAVQQIIANPTTSSGDVFGGSVAIDSTGTTIAVTSSGFNSALPAPGVSGAIYVYTRSGTTWSLQQTISFESDPNVFVGDDIKAVVGRIVRLSGDGNTLVVNESGSGVGGTPNSFHPSCLRIFTRSGSTWTQQDRITFPDQDPGLTPSTSAYAVGTGFDLSEDGNYILASAPGVGTAVFFTRSGGVWSQSVDDYFQYNDTTLGFGRMIAMADDASVCVAQTKLGDGRVEIWRNLVGVGWSFDAAITGPGGSNAYYGYQAMAMSGDGLRIAFNGTSDSDGNVLVYRDDGGGTWTLEATLENPAVEADDIFGGAGTLSFNASGTQLVIGACDSSTDRAYGGRIFLFTRSGTTWTSPS